MYVATVTLHDFESKDGYPVTPVFQIEFETKEDVEAWMTKAAETSTTMERKTPWSE